ncbi:hypothetical protein IT072_18440 [Leifsonia sp. ZF2019]|uniref:hypothetical protein n=1 Tax=Leifsonia sp. ZF2019 TaxID=2781978 RepID=UPI001CBB12F0|nr:hypothetical protein [Leifsonia sp. ZF2019]UAJ79159.1 hypothetical protein IT072_18440 [Leifsonia sp. ZF2019]
MTMERIVLQFVVVAVMTAATPIALVVSALLWQSPAAQVPSHWSFTGTPEVQSSTTVFLIALVPSVLCSIVAVFCAIFLRGDVGRWTAAIGLGALVLVAAFSSLIWPVAQLTAATPSLENRIGPPFALFGIALALGAGAFVIAATRAPAGTSLELLDDGVQPDRDPGARRLNERWR